MSLFSGSVLVTSNSRAVITFNNKSDLVISSFVIGTKFTASKFPDAGYGGQAIEEVWISNNLNIGSFPYEMVFSSGNNNIKYFSYGDFIALGISLNNKSFLVPIVIGLKDNNKFVMGYTGSEWVSVSISNGTFDFSIPDDGISTGLSQLVTSGNIKASVYNGKSYPPGATIPLDPSVEEISLVNNNYTMTLNDTQNMKQVQIGSTVYKEFPVTQTLSANTVVNMSGKDDPVITVDYTNTGKPTVSNT